MQFTCKKKPKIITTSITQNQVSLVATIPFKVCEILMELINQVRSRLIFSYAYIHNDQTCFVNRWSRPLLVEGGNSWARPVVKLQPGLYFYVPPEYHSAKTRSSELCESPWPWAPCWMNCFLAKAEPAFIFLLDKPSLILHIFFLDKRAENKWRGLSFIFSVCLSEASQ